MTSNKISTLNRCKGCYLRVDLCLCPHIPTLTTDFCARLITHERELDKTSNTGRLVRAAFGNVHVHRWQRKTPMVWIPSRQPVLLYPCNETPVQSDFSRFSASTTQAPLNNVEWVILDATWQQAEKMLRQSAQLQALPRFSIPVTTASRYQLRRNQRRDALSTIETVAALLTHIDVRSDATKLMAIFSEFQRRYEAMRSNHNVNESLVDEDLHHH